MLDIRNARAGMLLQRFKNNFHSKIALLFYVLTRDVVLEIYVVGTY